MAATRTGTASQVDASAGNGSTSVTVPADCNAIVAWWSHWDGNTSSILGSLALDGVPFTTRSEIAEGVPSDAGGGGIATLVSPATGSQTLAWTWSAGGARSEGGKIILVYVKDANTSDVYRDADTGNVNEGDLAVTIDSAATDLVLAFCQSTGSTPVLSGTVFIDNAALNSQTYDASEVTAGASTTTVTMTGEEFSVMSAISLKEAAAAGGTTTTIPTGTRFVRPRRDSYATSRRPA